MRFHVRNFIIRYMAGALAFALVCFCLLCILCLTTSAHASAGSAYHAAQTPLDITPTDTSTPSPTVTSTPSATVTNTPSPTVTNTPSPTVTNTPSPTATSTPSPTVTKTPLPTATTRPTPGTTGTVSPSPTSTSSAGVHISPTAAVSPIGTSTNTLGTGTNRGSADSPTPANNSRDSSSSGANPLINTLPFILAGLGGIGLLVLLFILARNMLRKRLVPLPSPKLSRSGAAPWSRTPVPASAQPGQPFPFAQPGNGPFNMPSGTPFPDVFNAAPTLANVPANAWHYSATPPGPLPSSPPPVAPAFPGYASQAQIPQPFPAPPAALTTSGYAGLSQNQQPFPTTPPFLPVVQVGYASNQSRPPANLAPPGNPLTDANQPGDSPKHGARKRLRRNGLRTSGEHVAFPGQISGDHSTGMMVVSDPHLRAMLKQHTQTGQIVKQAPE